MVAELHKPHVLQMVVRTVASRISSSVGQSASFLNLRPQVRSLSGASPPKRRRLKIFVFLFQKRSGVVKDRKKLGYISDKQEFAEKYLEYMLSQISNSENRMNTFDSAGPCCTKRNCSRIVFSIEYSRVLHWEDGAEGPYDIQTEDSFELDLNTELKNHPGKPAGFEDATYCCETCSRCFPESEAKLLPLG